ncbi:DUF4468 domain-containing protein [Hymenobacter ruber]
MKCILPALISLFASFALKAQTAPTVSTDESGRAQLVLVMPATGSQDDLFIKGKDWVFKTYNSGKTVEQYEDKTAGRLVVHARAISLTWKAGLGIVNDAGAFTYDMALDFKDGKTRMLIDNIKYKKGELNNSMALPSGADLADTYPANWPTLARKAMTARWNGMQETTKADLMALASSFQSAIIAQNKGKDW